MKNKDLFIRIYAITVTAILGYFSLTAFREKQSKGRFKEITVERINIVDSDGKLAMVMSNSERQHPGMMDGKKFPKRHREPGLIFFNKEGDEVGGLIFEGSKNEGAGMVLSFDQYKNDQIMQMQYMRTPAGKQAYGMNLWDRSEKLTLPRLMSAIDSLKSAGVTEHQKMMDILTKMNNGIPVAVERLFAGKNFNNQTGVFIRDDHGRERIKIYVGADNLPTFQILNEEGKVVKEMIGD